LKNGHRFGEIFGGMLGASPQTPGIYRFGPSTGFAEWVGWVWHPCFIVGLKLLRRRNCVLLDISGPNG
jgi:hypothetical protein